jgi:hypothetical protein
MLVFVIAAMVLISHAPAMNCRTARKISLFREPISDGGDESSETYLIALKR